MEVGRDLWRSPGPSPLLKQAHLEPAKYITPTAKYWFLMCSWNIMPFSLCPFPLVLSVHALEKSLAPSPSFLLSRLLYTLIGHTQQHTSPLPSLPFCQLESASSLSLSSHGNKKENFHWSGPLSETFGRPPSQRRHLSHRSSSRLPHEPHVRLQFGVAVPEHIINGVLLWQLWS